VSTQPEDVSAVTAHLSSRQLQGEIYRRTEAERRAAREAERQRISVARRQYEAQRSAKLADIGRQYGLSLEQMSELMDLLSAVFAEDEEYL
jgi:hypothetical protein